ncbi:MAG: peptidylprolyl isomerase [Phycisphaerales bacterium JB039]
MRFIGASLLILAACTLAACAGPRAPARDLTVRDFRAAPGAAPRPESPQTAPPPAPLPEAAPAGPALEVVARPGAPEPPEDPQPVTAMVVVDEKVGEINTKPVYAAEFLAPMAARMRQEARDMSPGEWRRFARDRIAADLEARINNELILADSYAQLPASQRQGLGVILEDIFRRERSATRGSEALVERQLREQNTTLGDEWQRKREDLLIQLRLRELRRQVQVSADEVALAYERSYDQWNPDPRAIFRRIRVRADDQEALSRITARLEAGEPFGEVAEDPANLNNPEAGGLLEDVGSFTGPYQDAVFFSSEPLQEAARSLAEGQWAGPVQTGSTMSWLFLERIERKSVSLFEAQPSIRAQLETIRFNEILESHFNQLKARSSFTDIGEMTDRLLAIAERWYLEPALAGSAGAP